MKRLAVLVFIVVVVRIMHAPMSGATTVKPTIHFVGDSITVGATPMLGPTSECRTGPRRQRRMP
jgi:hypothetical protein